MSDRQVDEASEGSAAAGNDPLAELARIFSGRATPTVGGSPSRGRTVPSAAGTAKPVEPDVLGDLEAELLSDLQASFSSIKETFASAPRPAVEPPAPPPVAEAPRPTEPPMRQPAQPASAMRATQLPPVKSQPAAPQEPPEPRAKAPPSTAEPARPPLTKAIVPPVMDTEHPAAALPPAEDATTERKSQRPQPQHKPAAPPKPVVPQPPLAERAPRPAESERGLSPLGAPDAAPRIEIPEVQPRPAINIATPAGQTSARTSHPRWERPAEPEKASVASRFAPPRAPAPPPADYGAVEDELFGDGTPFAEAIEAELADEELPFSEFDMVPGYGDEEQPPPYADDDYQDVVRRRSGRGPLIFAIAVGLVLVAGLSYVVFRPGQGTVSPPPIITADGSPTKIAPPDTPQPESDQNKLIYDRVASGNPTSDNTTLVTPSEQPVAQVPTADGGADDNPISRVIIPGGPGFDTSPAGGATSPDNASVADAGQQGDDFGPRKVRTVVVRPDGTIVSSEAAAPGAAPDVASSPADVSPITPAPTAVTEPPPATPSAPADPNNDTLAIAGPNGGVDANGELQITPLTGPSASPSAGQQAAVEQPAQAPVVNRQPTPTRTPTVANNAPINITPAAPTPTPRPPASAPSSAQTQTAALAPNGGMLVQVSSQRSEDAARATFRDLQSRYPGILGQYEVNIQRADLGDRGVYYRARVGPFSPDDAQRLCDDLKAAGGDCILSRR